MLLIYKFLSVWLYGPEDVNYVDKMIEEAIPNPRTSTQGICLLLY